MPKNREKMISFLFVAFLILNIQAFDVPIRTSTLSVKYPSSRLENSFNLFHIKRWNAATDYKTTNTGLYRGIQQNKSQNHPLFSSNGSEIDGSKKPSSVRQNLHVLARLSISGILAYAYMNYFAFATFGSLGYYLFQKTVAKKGVKDGEWIMLGFIVLGLAVLKKILGPAKLALELVVTSFFSYLFLTLAQGDL